MLGEHRASGQCLPNSTNIGVDQQNMKEVMKKESSLHSAASTVDTDYSSETSEVEHYLNEVAHSPRLFSLTDARMALSYVKGKMKQQEKIEAGDSQGKVPFLVKHHKSSSKTYSSFHRPERNVIHHKMELLKKDDKKTFNIYTSNVDFVEQHVSISMIEDSPTVKVIPAEYDDQCDALRWPSKVRVPSLPPMKPPPLQRHTSASRKHTPQLDGSSNLAPSNQKQDDDVSVVTHVEIANMSSVVLDLESSNDCCDLLSYGT